MPPTVLFLCSGNYYRSRFAELVFNHAAEKAELDWRATSAGLTPESFAGNPGPLASVVVAALEARSIPIASPRAPQAATREQFLAASRIVALSEREHRPLVAERFPEFADGIEYWAVEDGYLVAPEIALPQLEALVVRLVEDLATAAR